MKDQPLISIITVVYNGERYLQQTIDSVKNQTYKNIEYIIVDGASSDTTLEIIKKNNQHISKWISEPDQGLYDAMNKGIKLSNGQIIGTINSDDWYEPNAVQQVVQSYLSNPQKKIFHGDIKYINVESGSTYIKQPNLSYFLLKYHGMTLNHPTMFVHCQIYENIKYNVNLNSLSDYQFVLTNVLKDKKQFQYIPKIISNFRSGGISSNITKFKSLRENFIARRKAGMSFAEAYCASLLRVIFLLFKFLKQ